MAVTAASPAANRDPSTDATIAPRIHSASVPGAVIPVQRNVVLWFFGSSERKNPNVARNFDASACRWDVDELHQTRLGRTSGARVPSARSRSAFARNSWAALRERARAGLGSGSEAADAQSLRRPRRPRRPRCLKRCSRSTPSPRSAGGITKAPMISIPSRGKPRSSRRRAR